MVLTKKLKNYTTSINENKTIGEIEKSLAVMGAKQILKDYDAGGHVVAISFLISYNGKNIPIRLPINLLKIQSIFNELVEEKELPRKYLNNTEQARRTGWRIIKDWLEAQLTIIKIRQAELTEVFLPYVVVKGEKTLYEVMKEKGLMLEDKSKNSNNFKVIDND